MTVTSDGVRRDASDRTQCYEQLRTRTLEARHAPIAARSAVVLVRQGMSAWMQLDDSADFAAPARSEIASRRPTSSPAPEHSELLVMLTSLVLNCNRQESA